MDPGNLGKQLREEALATNERRLLVLAGDRERTRREATTVMAETGVDPTEVSYVGTGDLPYERLEPQQAGTLLGTTREAVILDCHDECRPNALGRVVGAVDGGGLLVLLVPPIAAWPDRRDGFDESLAVPPFDLEDVAGNFRRRLVATLRAHRGIALVDVDSETIEKEGLVDPAPRRPRPDPTPPEIHEFPRAAYEACLTQGQTDALAAFERLRTDGEAIVVEADRGRGKSSAAGLAAACLAREGMDVLVTAPGYRNAAELFERAAELLDEMGVLESRDRKDGPRALGVRTEIKKGGKRKTEARNERGRIRFLPPVEATQLPGDPDRVVVDEAAGLPVRLLEEFLSAAGVAFTTTVHGYEGAGRSFSVRFRDRLAESSLSVTDVSLDEPIRYAPGDPIEVWAFRALALDARPPVADLVTDATPASVQYRELDPETLLADEHLLRETFGLLVLAHYRTEPNDFARMLNAPNVATHALCADGHVVCVALVAREGGFSVDLRASLYEGGRVRGNMLPDLLTSQLRDEDAGKSVGHRVLRLATHEAIRSRGLGSRLVSEIRRRCSADWLGVGFGATPDLVSFWRENGFSTVHLGTSHSERSGEHSVLMLDPLSAAGEDLFDRHTEWFLRRVPSTLADPLSDLDPDVVRAVLGAVDGTPSLALTDLEWRVAAGLASGAAVYDTAPRPVRRLVFRHLVAPDGDVLSARQERLLVRKALQGVAWETVTEEFGFHARAECMRAVSGAADELVDLYGGDADGADRGRFR